MDLPVAEPVPVPKVKLINRIILGGIVLTLHFLSYASPLIEPRINVANQVAAAQKEEQVIRILRDILEYLMIVGVGLMIIGGNNSTMFATIIGVCQVLIAFYAYRQIRSLGAPYHLTWGCYCLALSGIVMAFGCFAINDKLLKRQKDQRDRKKFIR